MMRSVSFFSLNFEVTIKVLRLKEWMQYQFEWVLQIQFRCSSVVIISGMVALGICQSHKEKNVNPGENTIKSYKIQKK